MVMTWGYDGLWHWVYRISRFFCHHRAPASNSFFAGQSWKKTNIHLQIYTQKTCRGQTFGCAAPKLKKKTWPENNLNVWKTSGDPFCSYGQGSRPSSSFGRKAQKCLESTSYKSKAIVLRTEFETQGNTILRTELFAYFESNLHFWGF